MIVRLRVDGILLKNNNNYHLMFCSDNVFGCTNASWCDKELDILTNFINCEVSVEGTLRDNELFIDYIAQK